MISIPLAVNSDGLSVVYQNISTISDTLTASVASFTLVLYISIREMPVAGCFIEFHCSRAAAYCSFSSSNVGRESMFALMNSKFGRLVSLFAVIFCPVKPKRFFNTWLWKR